MFTHPSVELYSVVVGEYSFSIILLSVAIASFACYTAISMNERMQENSFFHHNLWLILASIAMGFGIWSMHFVGMGAYLLPISMSYEPSTYILVDYTSNCKFIFSVLFSQPHAEIDWIKSDFGGHDGNWYLSHALYWNGIYGIRCYLHV